MAANIPQRGNGRMIIAAWQNGERHKSGAGYGFKVSIADRDEYFDRRWSTVFVTLPNGIEVEANINKKSFWTSSCREVICRELGEWLIGRGFESWENGNPPKFILSYQSQNRFTIEEL